MAKRKRTVALNGDGKTVTAASKKSKSSEASSRNALTNGETIQIIVGSYDRILHGLIATVGSKDEADFADTFLFNAHTSAIRCVALSPPSAPAPGQTQKILLASGSTDERINVYNLSAHPPSRKNQELLAQVAPRPILENLKNREIGTLLHHESSVTALRFPTRSKLLSSSEDSTIAVTRTRDWSLLSKIKAPKATALGRPSGDTAAFGATPSGVNDFAIHPSMKLMISVSKAERCMRLWNLVTGKKAGVLNFEKDMLQEVGEGRHSTGEGQKVVWGNVDGADEFAVAFGRDVMVFGMDSKPKCRVLGSSGTKIHHMAYVVLDEQSGDSVLAVATEDGRVVITSTKADDLSHPEPPSEEGMTKSEQLSSAKTIGFIGGKDAGVSSRVKDFAFLRSEANPGLMYLAAGGSDGKIRLWRISVADLKGNAKTDTKAPMGKLLGTYETQNRITCMAAFVMIPRPDGAEDSEEEDLDEEEDEEDVDSDED